MPDYKGNAGHLMQHWTLCELLDIAQKKQTPGLSFIDAHAMAPLADKRRRANAAFDRARVCPPNERSVYQRAWHYLAPISGYPNSAAFVNRVWENHFSLLLCETDQSTIDELLPWVGGVRNLQMCTYAELFPGDWRGTINKEQVNHAAEGSPEGSVTLVSFDPDMYYPIPPANATNRNLYPDDLTQTLAALEIVNGGVIIQMSTYSRGRRNEAPQNEVIHSANEILTGGGFDPAVVVRLNGDMMSLIYARQVPYSWAAQLEDLPQRFTYWIAPLRRRRRR